MTSEHRPYPVRNRFCGIRWGLLSNLEISAELLTGNRTARAALNLLMADAHRRRCSPAGLLVWRIDRFGLSLRHLVNALADLDSAGVSFVSLHDNLDLTPRRGRQMF